jgi:hypothetical protein
MKNKRILSLLVLCAIMSTSLMGCEQISSTSEIGSSTDSSETTISSEIDSTSDNVKTDDTTQAEDESTTDSVVSDTHSNIDELSESVGFTAYDLTSSGYVPVSYETVDNNIAQITYNHDGNTATLRMSDTKSDNLAGINGTENADVYSIPDYNLDIDIQENDDKYIAQWNALDMDGEEKYFSLVEENVDIAVFETTISSFVKATLASEQPDNTDVEDDSDDDSNDSDDEETTVNEGTVVATCEDSFETYVYKVEKSGSYKFTDPVSDNDTMWDIYILDEEFEDAPRYISQAYTSQGSTPVTLELKEGQYAYCICNKNQWTVDEAVDCKLTITYFD